MCAWVYIRTVRGTKNMAFRALKNENGDRVIYQIKNIVTKAVTEHKAFLDSDNNVCFLNGCCSFIRLSDLKGDGIHKITVIA